MPKLPAMTTSQDSIFSFRTFVVSGLVVVGTGVGVLLYQQYLLSQSQRELLSEVRRLSYNISKLEAELKRATLVHSPTSDFDEIFVDASESEPEPPTLKSEEEVIQLDGTNGYVTLVAVFAQVDDQMQEAGPDNLKAANETLKLLTQSKPGNAQVYWRLAKSFFLLASDDLIINQSNDGSDQQKELMKKAFEAAEMAVDFDNQCGDAYKWLAIIRGSITQFLPIQDQIKSAYIIKEDIVTSLRLNPNDSLCHHMLGRWCYSVYSLSWFERRMAATLFASPPTATLEEAMDSFLKAEEIAPKESIDNCLYLAKCYVYKRDYNQAVLWLRQGLKIKGSSRDDIKSREEIQALLAQYESYATS